jgi:colicin import membrane protein
MHKLRRTLGAWLTAAALLAGACSKSVEGETRKWTANSARVDELGAQYPGFKSALQARKTAAQQLHDAAGSLDGDAKIEKLAAANSALMAGFVHDLEALEAKVKQLREARVEAAAKAGDQTRLGAKVAAEDAQKALDRVDAALKAGAADEAAAAAVLRKLGDDLDTAQRALDKVLAVDQAKKDEAAAAKTADEAAEAKEAADAAAKVAPWKCAYCDAQNPHDEASCKSCGAPRGDARAGDAKAAEAKK